MQNDQQVQCITIQWAAGTKSKRIFRTTTIQHYINALNNRDPNNLINASDLLTSLFYAVAKKN